MFRQETRSPIKTKTIVYVHYLIHGPKFGGVAPCQNLGAQQLHSWIHGSAVATSISIPRSAAAAEGRDPRSTAAEGSDRPKAAINGGRRPASGPSTLPPQRLQLQSQPIPFPHFSPVFLGHRSSSHFRALLSAAPSPETLIPPLSLPLPRLPSHVHSNTC